MYMVPADLHMQLLKAKEAAEAASRAKGEFLGNLSHEVRTAINSIIGFTDVVLATELNPEQRGDLNLVKDAADSLLRMINDAVDYFQTAGGSS